MNKIVLVIIILLSLVFFLLPQDNVFAHDNNSKPSEIEEQLEEIINQELNGFDWDELQEFFYDNTENEFLNFSLLDTTKEILSGNFSTDALTFLEYIINIFFNDFKKIFPLLVSMAIICILSGIVGKTKSNLLSDSTGNLINFFFFSTVLLLVLGNIWDLYNMATKAVYSIKSLSNITMPILLTLVTATGSTVSSKVYSPAIGVLSGGVTEIVAGIILPLFVFSIVFCIVSNMSQDIKLKQFSNFFKKISNWVLGITFTVFTGFLAIQGLTAGTIDGVSIRAAKFATKTYIPILGGYLADGFDLILASCILIKNSFGLVVLLVLLGVVLSPIINVIVFNLGLNFISAIMEPVTDNSIVGFLSEVGKSLSILLVSIIAVTFMFFVLVMMIIFSANVY